MKAGSKRYLKSDYSHCYVKLDNDEFGWWRLEDEKKEEDRRMLVRMTDDQALSENWFTVLKVL